MRIPHRSYYAYGETIAAEEQLQREAGSLVEAYRRFLACLQFPSLRDWAGSPESSAVTSGDEWAMLMTLRTYDSLIAEGEGIKGLAGYSGRSTPH